MRFSDDMGFYELNPFPGCNQIVVSNHAFIYPQFRGKGYGNLQHKERLARAKALGYNFIICSVKSQNIVELRILVKNGWNRLDCFKSIETGNDIEIWGRPL